MFIKRKTRTKGLYLPNVSLSFKTLVCLTLRRTNASVMKQLLSDIARFFAKHCPMSGANIQCNSCNLKIIRKEAALAVYGGS